jgi:uncharacterized protein (DUF2164 family)
MIRRLILLTVILSGFAIHANAQEVFRSVMESAQKALNDPVKNFMKTQVAQFKIDELNYLKSKAVDTDSLSKEEIMDIQAYFMSEFLTRYFTEIIYNEGQPDSVKKSMIFLFVNASAVCPLFNDTDKAKINKYIDADKQITPFCLDTDWKKALTIVNRAME